MARTFNTEAERSQLSLKANTRQKIAALILDLDLSASEVVDLAVTQLYASEIEDRPTLEDQIAALTARVEALETGA